MQQLKLPKTTAQHVYFWTLGAIFIAFFLFFNFNYRYIDDYRLFIHNNNLAGFLSSYKWGFSRIIGNYFFGLFYLPQNNIFLNLCVVTCHLLNGWMIYKLLSKSGSRTLAFFSSLFFISIPVTSEAFFWALAGQVVYAIFFFLWAVKCYQDNETHLKFKHGVAIVSLFALSIGFYEVMILFPFLFLLVCLWRKKHILLGAALSAVSVGYLGTLKLLVYFTGGTLTASQKTTLIGIHDISTRVSRIISDLFSVFFGKVAVMMYRNSLFDAFHGKVPVELLIVVGLFVVLSLFFIWVVNTEKVRESSPELFTLILGLLSGCALAGLLIIPVNYFHDLRTFYPFSICLAFFVCEYLRYISRSPLLLKLHLTIAVLIIGLNVLVLRVENYYYAKLFQDDWSFVQQLEKDAKVGKTTIVYLPGYNSKNPIETQMNLAYYPETNFIYGTHMLAAPSIQFTRTPFLRLGNRQEIATRVGTNYDKYVIHDFLSRKTVSSFEFLNPGANGVIDLTMLEPEKYTLRNIPTGIGRYDGEVVYDRKLYKTFVTHPNCSEPPATIDVVTPSLKGTCQVSYRLLNVNDTENRTTSDGTQFRLLVNGSAADTVKLQAKDSQQAHTVYHHDVIPSASGSAQLSFEITDGGSKNCNDDKIFIAEPLLRCQ